MNAGSELKRVDCVWKLHTNERWRVFRGNAAIRARAIFFLVLLLYCPFYLFVFHLRVSFFVLFFPLVFCFFCCCCFLLFFYLFDRFDSLGGVKYQKARFNSVYCQILLKKMAEEEAAARVSVEGFSFF